MVKAATTPRRWQRLDQSLANATLHNRGRCRSCGDAESDNGRDRDTGRKQKDARVRLGFSGEIYFYNGQTVIDLGLGRHMRSTVHAMVPSNGVCLAISANAEHKAETEKSNDSECSSRAAGVLNGVGKAGEITPDA